MPACPGRPGAPYRPVVFAPGAVDDCRGLRRSIGLSRRRYCSPTPVFRCLLLLLVSSRPGDDVCGRLDEVGDTVVSADRKDAAFVGLVPLRSSIRGCPQWFVLAERRPRECSQEPGELGFCPVVPTDLWSSSTLASSSR
jgi:hypothetical protein